MAQAPAADQAKLLAVQDLDTRIQQARHRLDTLPERAECATLNAQIEQVGAARIEAATAVSDARREVAKAEDDVQTVRARAQRDNARLLDAGMAPRELQGLQSELAVLAKRQSDLEDVELEAMQRLDDAEHALATVTERAEALQVQLGEATARLEHEEAAVNTELAMLASDREGAIDGIDAALVALYEKLRLQYGGVGAAALKHGTCEGCHMSLNPADVAALQARPADDVVRCEECGRILVRGAAS